MKIYFLAVPYLVIGIGGCSDVEYFGNLQVLKENPLELVGRCNPEGSKPKIRRRNNQPSNFFGFIETGKHCFRL